MACLSAIGCDDDGTGGTDAATGIGLMDAAVRDARSTQAVTDAIDATQANVGDATSTDVAPDAPAFQLTDAEQTLVDLLEDRAAQPNVPPLFQRHLLSIARIVRLYRGAASYSPGNQVFAQTPEFVDIIVDGFQNGDAGDYASYLSGKRPLVFGWLSALDGSASHLLLNLPADFNESRIDYPVFVELHGSGGGRNNNQIGWLHRYLASDWQGPGVNTAASQRRDGFHLLMWGRGDHNYTDVQSRTRYLPAEGDIWEGLAQFDAVFASDPQRQYLYGFSMGGAGTFRLGGLRPQRWAGLGMFGGSAPTPETYAPAVAAAGLPTYFVFGENDAFARPLSEAARDALIDQNHPPAVFRMLLDTGHRYLFDEQLMLYDWLLTQSRP